jgi:hypothetical protein
MPGLLVIALPFAIIGGLMAFLITFHEMQHHFGRKRAAVEAAKTGVVACLVLVVVALVVAAVMPSLALSALHR